MRREIKGLKGFYASDKGKIYNNNNRELKKYINANGYYYVIINNRFYSIDFVIAKTFIPNEKFILVRHKDKNKLNNCVENLEWYYDGEIESTNSGKVVEYDIDGNIINEWNNAKECAADTNYSIATIRQNCEGFSSITKDNRIFRYSADKFVRPILKEEKNQLNGIKILEYDRELNIINSFNSIKEISSEIRNSGTICGCLNNKQLEWKNRILKYDYIPLEEIKSKIETKYKKVYKFSLDGELINIYESSKECAKIENINFKTLISSISSCKKIKEYYYSYSQTIQGNEEIRTNNGNKEKEINNKSLKTATPIKQTKPIKKKRGIKKGNVILMVNKETNIIIKEFKNFKVVMKELNISEDTIRSYMTGRRGQNKEYKLIFKKDFKED